jgi:hypothetical protein
VSTVDIGSRCTGCIFGGNDSLGTVTTFSLEFTAATLLVANAFVFATVECCFILSFLATVIVVADCTLGSTLFDEGKGTSCFFSTVDALDISVVACCCISHPFMDDDVVAGALLSVVATEGIVGIVV